MAHGFHVSQPVCAMVGGRVYTTWTITETDVAVTSLASATTETWTIDGLPPFFTITLFEATAGGVAIKPELGLVPTWVPRDEHHVAEDVKHATWVRNDCPLRITAPSRQLCGRARPNGNGAPKVVTRITIVEGH